MHDQTFEDVAILGAGLSGLGCARNLPGSRVFESKAHAGGHAWSHAAGGFHFDEGAHICHSQDQAYLEMISASAGTVTHVPRSRVVNWRKGGWITYPVQNHLWELDLVERTAAVTDFVSAQIERAGRPPAHYLDWCLNQYGRYLTENFYAIYTAKYWRTPMEQLATDWLSGRLLSTQVNRVIAGALGKQRDDQAVFSAFRYPKRGGYHAFYHRLYEGLNLRLNSKVVEVDLKARRIALDDGTIHQYGELVSSVSLPQFIAMVKDAPVSVCQAAAVLRHTQLLCVNLVISRPQLTDLHWFYIYDKAVEASRVSVVSNLTGGATQKTALQAEIFRGRGENFEVEALVENTVAHLTKILGFDRTEIELVHTVHVPHAYIISDLERARAVQHIHEWLASNHVYPIGMLGKWKFIWSDVAFRDGVQTAQQLGTARR